MQNDHLADALTRIRNSISAGHTHSKLRFSNKIKNLVQVLITEKLISGAKEIWEDDQHFLLLELLDFNGKPRINHLEIVSRPGRRVYVNHKSIPRVLGGVGIAIISTSNGLLSSRILKKGIPQKSPKTGIQRLGGEVLCYVW